MRETIYIKDFQYDPELIEQMKLLLVVKSFDVQAIRKRYLEARNNKSKKKGSVERRKAGLGGLIEIEIEGDRIIGTNVISKLKEPRALDMKGSLFALAPEDKILLVDRDLDAIENDWFSYIHTLKFHPRGNRILVCSSGFDCFYEYDLDKKEITYEWFSWENGLNKGKNAEGDSQYLTRDESIHKANIEAGKVSLHISDPVHQSLPTAQRAAFINACDYSSSDGKFILTLFHEGQVIEVDRDSGDWTVLIDNLKNPHGAQFKDEKYLLVTNTSEESFLIKDMDSAQEVEYSFTGMEGKSPELKDMSWIQNSIVSDGLIISIDSNRNSLIVTDIEKASYAMIAYDENWAVQDMLEAELTEKQRSLLSEISIPSE